MTQTSYYWSGTTTGDATLAPYVASKWVEIWRKMFQGDRTTQSVIPGYLGEMVATNPAGSTVRVASGGAIVDGTVYDNTDDVDFSVSTPTSGYYYYRVILRKNPTTQTVRLVLIGPSTVDYPSVAQTDGGIWEVSIARVKVSDAGAVTIYEGRRFSGSPLAGKVKLMEASLSAGASTVELGEIPQTYNHLTLVVASANGQGLGKPYVFVVLNGDTGGNYENLVTLIYENDTEVSTLNSAAGSVTIGQFAPVAADYKAVVEADFIDYASAKYKTVLGRSGGVAGAGTDSFQTYCVSQWKNTAAINKMVIGCSFDFVTGDKFTLYGWN